jgi:hypothetical protein
VCYGRTHDVCLTSHSEKEQYFQDETTQNRVKTLPPIPTLADSLSLSDLSDSATDSATPTPSTFRTDPVPQQRPSARPGSPPIDPPPLSPTHTLQSSSSTTSGAGDSSPVARLVKLRKVFKAIEQGLYTQLTSTPPETLNDARRAFLREARAASKRLEAWHRKHVHPADKESPPARPHVQEPEWWSKDCHAMPHSRVIVREKEWSSIIAFTLRCVAPLST